MSKAPSIWACAVEGTSARTNIAGSNLRLSILVGFAIRAADISPAFSIIE